MQAWDVNSPPPASLEGNQTVISASDLSPVCANIGATAAHLAAALADGGFLLLREYTGPHMLLLHALQGSSPARSVSESLPMHILTYQAVRPSTPQCRVFNACHRRGLLC